MAQTEGDAEIRALEAVYDALQPLDDEARSRVVDYTLKRLGMRELPPTPESPSVAPKAPEEQAQVRLSTGSSDIRSLREEKNPRTAIEMATVVAYYLAELAPEEERKDTVSSADLEKYFKQAQHPLPGRMASTLPNAAAAGYLDSAGRGEYRLNPVGFNLVTQNLPRGEAPVARRSGRKRTATKSRAKVKGTSAKTTRRTVAKKRTPKKRTR